MAMRPSHIKMTAQRDRHDFGALEQRVYGAERKIDELSVQTSSQIQNLRTELGGAIQLISTKIDQQQTAQIDSSRTKWTPIVTCATGLAVAFVAIFGVVGSMALTPIRADIEKLYKAIDETNNKMTPLLTLADDQKSNVIQFAALTKADEGKWSKDAQDEYEKRIDQVTAIYVDRAKSDLAEIKAANATTAADQIKRPEILTDLASLSTQMAAGFANDNERYTALSQRANDMQREFGANFTLGDAVKELQARVNQIIATPAPPPPGK